MQDTWPTAIETIALFVCIAAVAIAFFGGYPWQNRHGDEDND